MLKRGLGKGLGALLPESAGSPPEAAQEIAIRRIRANADQPRQVFDPERLAELAASIREHGVVQPILVRPLGDGFEIVAGERRWRAAQLAGLRTVPAVVRELTGSQVMEIALIENLQREDLNPLEEARAYRRLLDEFGLSQEQLAQRLGRSRPQVSNTLRLLQLQPEVQTLVEQGALSMGHAKVVLALDSPQAQAEAARRMVTEKLSVREAEAAVRSQGGRSASARGRPAARQPQAARAAAARPADYQALEDDLRERFGTPVAIQSGSSRGTVTLTFFGEADLTRLMDLLLGEGVPRGTNTAGQA